MDRLPTTVGELLQSWRRRAGLTQQELADRAGISVRGLRDLERDRVRRPRLASAGGLAAALGLSPLERDRLAALAAATGDRDGVAGLRIGVLGALQVRRDGVPVDLRAPMPRTLFGLLAVQPGQPVPYDEIVDVLWVDRPPRTCQELVRTYISRLRKQLGFGGSEPGAGGSGVGGIVALAHGGYRLELDADRIDLARFDAHTARARRLQAAGELDAAGEEFGQALRCWRGRVVADLGSRLAQHPAAAAAAQRRAAAALSYADIEVRQGRYRTAVEGLRDAARDEPLDEILHARLILALAGAGQRAAALQLFATVQARLVEELGVEPGPQLQAAHLAVLRQDEPAADAPPQPSVHTGLAVAAGLAFPAGPIPSVHTGPAAATGPASAGPVSSVHTGPAAGSGRPAPPTGSAARAGAAGPPAGATVRPAQLPADTWGFTGRKEYFERLDQLLPADPDAAAPVLMISAIAGAAGVGKTALAVRWARQVRHRFPDGQLHVNLQGYAAGPPLRPLDALARFLPALGVAASDVPADLDAAAALYRSLLAERRMLVLLDNAGSADQVRPLLPGGQGCLVVVTSRDQLRGLVAMDGAVSLSLDVLGADEAFTLLVRLLGPDRAHREPEAVAELARLCGHLPLALRIAAANLTTRPGTIADYAARLAHGDRLTALRVVGDPQAAVRAAFDHSYAGLPGPARRLFRLLGLAPGPDVTAAAAGALADLPAPVAADLLDDLAGAHLVDEPVPDRYTLHDLLRLCAAEHAGAEEPEPERQAALRRLLDHYLHRTAAAGDLLYPTVVRLPAAAEPSTGGAGSGGPAADRFDTHADALAWLDAERPNLVAAVRHAAEHGPYPSAWRLADALRGYLYARMLAVDWRVVAQAALRTAEAHAEREAQAAAHLSLATLHWTQGSYQQAVKHYTRAANLARLAGWVDGESVTLGNFAALYTETGRLAEAADLYHRALAIKRRTGRVAGQARDLANLSVVRVRQGLLAAAADCGSEALALYRQTGSRIGEGQALAYLGEAQHLLGRLADAYATLTRAVEIHREVGDRETESETLAVLAAHHRDTGRYRRGLTLGRAALDLARETGDRRAETDALTITATVYAHLGRPVPAISGLEQAVELTRSVGKPYGEADALTGLATTHWQIGQYERAAEHADAALAIARGAGYRLLEANAVTTLAVIDLLAGRPEGARSRAVEALAGHAATGHRLGQARTHLVAGGACQDLGDGPAAAEHRRRAHAILTEIGAPHRLAAGPLLGPLSVRRRSPTS